MQTTVSPSLEAEAGVLRLMVVSVKARHGQGSKGSIDVGAMWLIDQPRNTSYLNPFPSHVHPSFLGR